MSISKTKKEIGYNKTADDLVKSRKTAKVNEQTRFYAATIKQRKHTYEKIRKHSDDDEYDLRDKYYDETSEEFQIDSMYGDTKLIVVENNGEFSDFLTNTPIVIKKTKEEMFAEHKYEELLKKKCFFVESLREISKEEVAEVLKKIKEYDEDEKIWFYCHRIHNFLLEAKDEIKTASWEYKEEIRKKEYKEPTADELISYFVNKKVKR